MSVCTESDHVMCRMHIEEKDTLHMYIYVHMFVYMHTGTALHIPVHDRGGLQLPKKV